MQPCAALLSSSCAAPSVGKAPDLDLGLAPVVQPSADLVCMAAVYDALATHAAGGGRALVVPHEEVGVARAAPRRPEPRVVELVATVILVGRVEARRRPRPQPEDEVGVRAGADVIAGPRRVRLRSARHSSEPAGAARGAEGRRGGGGGGGVRDNAQHEWEVRARRRRVE